MGLLNQRDALNSLTKELIVFETVFDNKGIIPLLTVPEEFVLPGL